MSCRRSSAGDMRSRDSPVENLISRARYNHIGKTPDLNVYCLKLLPEESGLIDHSARISLRLSEIRCPRRKTSHRDIENAQCSHSFPDSAPKGISLAGSFQLVSMVRRSPIALP